MRITGQLIDAATGAHLWAERYDRAPDDLFDLQDEITQSVVGAIEPTVRKAEIERARRKHPDNLDATTSSCRPGPDIYSRIPGTLGQSARRSWTARSPSIRLMHWRMPMPRSAMHSLFSRGGLQ